MKTKKTLKRLKKVVVLLSNVIDQLPGDKRGKSQAGTPVGSGQEEEFSCRQEALAYGQAQRRKCSHRAAIE